MRTLFTLLGIVTLLAPALGQEQEGGKVRPGLWTFHGRAIDEDGRPIEGACVSHGSPRDLSTAATLETPRARTGANGRFEISWPETTREEDRVPARILIAAPGRAAAFLNPSILATLSMGRPGSQVFDLGEVTLPPAVTLRGRVHSEDGHPLAGARVVETYRNDLSLELSRVRVTLVPDKPGQDMALSMLEVLVEYPEIDTGITGLVYSESSPETNMGVRLANDMHEITIYLPPLTTIFRLRSEFHRLLNPAGMSGLGKPLGEQTYTPDPGTNNRLTIRVPPLQVPSRESPPKKRSSRMPEEP